MLIRSSVIYSRSRNSKGLWGASSIGGRFLVAAEIRRDNPVIHLGTDIKGRGFKKLESRLVQWLDDGEVIIAAFQTTRMKPSVQRLILTNRRLLTTTVDFKKISDDVAAGKIAGFTLDATVGKATKVYVANKDGTKTYLGLMRKEEALIINDFLPKMSGAPQSIQTKMNEQIAAKKAAEKANPQPRTRTQRIFSNIGGLLLTISLTATLGFAGFLIGGILWYLFYRNNEK